MEIDSAKYPTKITPSDTEPHVSWFMLIILPLNSSLTFDWIIVEPSVVNITFENEIIENIIKI